MVRPRWVEHVQWRREVAGGCRIAPTGVMDGEAGAPAHRRPLRGAPWHAPLLGMVADVGGTGGRADAERNGRMHCHWILAAGRRGECGGE
jgi:hypothetical protein